MKQCYFCNGPMTEQVIEFKGKWGSKRVHFTKVPAEICGQCGERYFAPQVSREMKELVQHTGQADGGHDAN